MPQNHRLQFSVEESICFQKGQEVSELLSISLDPDIRVQEVNDYVSIRGSLELTGEYNIDQSKNTEEFYTDKRFVEEVRTREDGTAELTHCFPVDITIPKNKVSHLHEVFVFIDAFDYQLTDSRILTIQADLAIEGLLDDTADREQDIPLYEAPDEGFSEPPELFALEAEDSVEEAPAEPPELVVSETRLREEQENEEEEAERSEPLALKSEDSEDIKAEEAPAEPPELLVSETRLREEQENEEEEAERSAPLALKPEDSEDIKAEEAPAEPPELVVSEARLREEQENEKKEAERSAPLALKAEESEDIKAEEASAEPPELVVSEAGLREEQADEKEEAERSAPLDLKAEESGGIKAEEARAEPSELVVSEAGLREEQADEKEEAERSAPLDLKAEENGGIKAEEARAEPSELVVSEARLREEQANEEKETVRSESAALEPEGSKDINGKEAKPPELILSETRLREEAETIEADSPKAASGIEIREKTETEEEQAELSEPRVSAAKISPAVEAELQQEAERGEEKTEKPDSPNLEHALRQESQKTESELSDHIEPAPRQDAEQPEEVQETIREDVVSLEGSREQEEVPAALLKEESAVPTLHFNQKISAEEESQEEELTPAYRTFLPEQDSEEHSFYSAPKLLEEEEQKKESFEIEVRKTPSPEEPEEEASFHSYQLPDTSEPERKETNAVAGAVPAAQTKGTETKENHNSLYLTKLFTREEDEFSRMKICIVQQEDTIERLCERYDITSQQLIRMNSLALDDELKAGQILYIPQYNSSHA
ncbi:LysM peptidoglycan-binding domain-containing protein [Bacillus halotolerans]|uniref:LysM peptidoglycan-binding domain-containing protein n=1 Tax=Bacillus halotolerans TaxID=260554 RepID=UPI00192AF107|nr:LysM peptidoglycan-binding domain-containing protein [Bacillus halotolerans]MBL4969613.1 LysM peptidoglycan-binding domain-containing protein [Bacillus halotolerans]MBL4973675.1 LysM peptidoglycan-binding domain-containing protein [Bacillus halotolerans]